MSLPPTLEFFFEFGSTYSYIASARIEALADAEFISETLHSLGESEARLGDSQAPDNKEALKEQTARATGLGIFGAPSFVTRDGELFPNNHMEAAFAWTSKAGVGS